MKSAVSGDTSSGARKLAISMKVTSSPVMSEITGMRALSTSRIGRTGSRIGLMVSTIGLTMLDRNCPRSSRTLLKLTSCRLPWKPPSASKVHSRWKSALSCGKLASKNCALATSPLEPITPSVSSRLASASRSRSTSTTCAKLRPPESSLKVSRLLLPTGSCRLIEKLPVRCVGSVSSSSIFTRRNPSSPPIAMLGVVASTSTNSSRAAEVSMYTPSVRLTPRPISSA